LKPNAHASGATSLSLARQKEQEVKMPCFAVYPQELLETQEVENLTARSR